MRKLMFGLLGFAALGFGTLLWLGAPLVAQRSPAPVPQRSAEVVARRRA